MSISSPVAPASLLLLIAVLGLLAPGLWAVVRSGSGLARQGWRAGLIATAVFPLVAAVAVFCGPDGGHAAAEAAARKDSAVGVVVVEARVGVLA